MKSVKEIADEYNMNREETEWFNRFINMAMCYIKHCRLQQINKRAASKS
ncbi:hypothetical protein [Bacillus cytotoxicus]|nr:hypothetical protein [Bacillus cytotoxicus]MDH2862386.1 hypothetical protein [Bacillus cytotoxicus]MDH2870395.1 hypothetical protein [Bacillus cytotoxicus]MDH2878447.1 hypothetical protein [Bacillus cytotoxicus]MDH2923539.1 hypothetical protein [Bacillus cytotoxicus]QTR65928.1 hypothetical protein JC776_13755 [Bacillus cytotoxicus]